MVSNPSGICGFTVWHCGDKTDFKNEVTTQNLFNVLTQCDSGGTPAQYARQVGCGPHPGWMMYVN